MATIPVRTLPVTVTVFPDRARVTRVGRVTLEPGQHRLEVDDLPLAIQPESVRASGKGTARARLLGVSTRIENYLDTPAEAVRELEATIQAAEDADADLAARAGVLEKERGYLEGLASQGEVFARGLALRRGTAEEIQATFEFVSSRVSALQSELLKTARERRALAKELDRLRREFNRLCAAQPRQRYVAVAEIEAPAAGELELELTYAVTGAGWTPLYDLRLLDSELDLTYLAQVAQNTGEDWPDVALTLSTARPALSLVVPELDPWYVRPWFPPRPLAEGVSRKAMAMPAAPLPSAEAAPAQQALEVESSVVSESGTSLTYRIGAGADVPGNGDPRKVVVGSFRLRPELDYVTAPKREDACYRRARLKNESAYTLLPGSAQLFEGDEYLGVTRLELTAPGQEFELVLGADERLRVERELVARDVDRTFIGDRRRVRYAYTVEVENLRDSAQTVFLRDQFPVSRDDQIRVKLEAIEPKPAEQTDLNRLEWKLSLAPGAKQTIRFEFSVEYPRTMEVVGLP